MASPHLFQSRDSVADGQERKSFIKHPTSCFCILCSSGGQLNQFSQLKQNRTAGRIKLETAKCYLSWKAILGVMQYYKQAVSFSPWNTFTITLHTRKDILSLAASMRLKYKNEEIFSRDQVTQQRHKKLYSLLGWFVPALSFWFKESTVDSVDFLDEDWRNTEKIQHNPVLKKRVLLFFTFQVKMWTATMLRCSGSILMHPKSLLDGC